MFIKVNYLNTAQEHPLKKYSHGTYTFAAEPVPQYMSQILQIKFCQKFTFQGMFPKFYIFNITDF